LVGRSEVAAQVICLGASGQAPIEISERSTGPCVFSLKGTAAGDSLLNVEVNDMNKRIALLLGGATALTAAGAVQAAPAAKITSPVAESYADLLAPIPDASAQLRADDAARAAAPRATFQLAQYHHHHHHHHHNGGFFPGAVIGGIIGGALASSPPPPDYYYTPGPDYGPPPPDVEYCMRHFHSYDPRSGTYMGYDGRRHPCP